FFFLMIRLSPLSILFPYTTLFRSAGNGGFLHCIQMDTSVNAANQVVSVGADIAFDADPKFFACLVRFESSSVPTTLPKKTQSEQIGRAVQQECRDRSRMPSSA